MLVSPIRQIFFEGDNQFTVEIPTMAFSRFFEIGYDILRYADSRFDQCLVFVVFLIHRCNFPYYIGGEGQAQEGDAKQRHKDSFQPFRCWHLSAFCRSVSASNYISLYSFSPLAGGGLGK